MNFTPQEDRAFQKLQKMEKQFQKLKWTLVILCVALVVATTYMMRVVASIPESFEGNFEFQAILYARALPTMYLSSIITGAIIGFTIKNWKGNPERVLLFGILKKLQANESEPAGIVNDEAAPPRD